MNIKTTPIYQHLEDNKDKRLLIFQGSARSGKTYNIIIWLVLYALQNPNTTISIVRKTLPALKGSALRDLKNILEQLNLFKSDNWKKIDGYFQFDNGSMIEWFSTDDEQKVRGRSRDICFVNEANEISRDEYVQLSIRTTNKMILDYNPSDLTSYIYDLIETEPDMFFNKSTYKDNPFLTPNIIKEIESLKDKDDNLWRVFGLGERGVATNTVFTKFHIIDELPKDGYTTVRAIDWGFNDPTAIVECRIMDDNLYIKELLYARGLTSTDIAYKIRQLDIDPTDTLWADTARPEIIEDLKREGINAKPTKKNSVLHGINLIKQHHVYIHKDSINAINEFTTYKWKTDKDDNLLDVPIDKDNHIIDCVRYCIEMQEKQKEQGQYLIL